MMIRTIDSGSGRNGSGKGSSSGSIPTLKGSIPTLKGRVFSISGSEKDLALLPLLVDKFVPALKDRVVFEGLFCAMELGVSVDKKEAEK